jgi:predicted MFS family arabinose efflux permease
LTPAASSPAPQVPSPVPRQSTLRLFLAFFAVLLLVLLLNGGLTLGALHKVQFESTTAAVRMVGHDWAQRIQGAIRFGKPIEQFYGLHATLTEIQKDLPAVATVAITNPQGSLIQSVGQAPMLDDLASSVRRTLAASKPVASKLQGRHYLVFPIQGREAQAAGALVMTVDEATITQALSEHLGRNLMVLAVVALLAALVLLAGLPLLGFGGIGIQSSRWRLFALPILVAVLAQGVYSWDSIHTFRQQYLGAVQETAKIAVQRLGRDFQRLFDKGVRIERLVGIEAPFKRIMDEAPEIGYMEMRAADGAVLYRVYRDGRLEKSPPILPLDSVLDLTTTFQATGQGQLGSLRLHLDEEAIAAGARQRLLDSGTVVLLSILFVIELFVLLGVLMRRQPALHLSIHQSESKSVLLDDGRHVLGRPTAFLLLFAWALPLSFIPLRMREIYTPILGLSEHVVLALPLSVEMLCALVTALVAGALTDRRGWHVPFLAGVVISLAGALFSSAADNVWTFMLARALVGAGYGLAWMGIQGFIVLWATPQTRAQGMAHLVAGIFAGHICGSAVGAMLAQQVGYTTVFLFSSALSLLPGLFVLIYMRSYFGLPNSGADVQAAQSSRKLDWPSVRQLLGDRNFALLMLGSVVPFSVAQVGLLYFTLPLFLVDQGVSQSSIGRIMMIYGLSVIYLGPFLGRYIDASHSKKNFIVLGGLVGSLGMIYLFFDKSLFAITLSVFALGLASSLAGAAQSAFALNLHAVQAMGMGKAMGVQRAADKLGQMIGPLLIGALFASVGAASGLAITGLLYLAATMLFLLFAQTPRLPPAVSS